MKALTRLIAAALFSIALFGVVITTAGCDEERLWESVSNPYGQVLLMDLLTRVKTYAVSISVDLTGEWSGLVISIAGIDYTLSSTSSLTFNIRTLASLIKTVSMSSHSQWSCSGFSTSLDKNTLTINISGCTAVN